MFQPALKFISNNHNGVDTISTLTLDDRMAKWAQASRKHHKKPSLFRGDRKGKAAKSLLVERLKTAHGVACALEYLHKNQILHRDVKTGNVGFGTDGNVKLFDFGLAILAKGSDKHQYGFAGTKRNMAPEVDQEKPYDEKADVFSFGVLLWDILAMGRTSCDNVLSAIDTDEVGELGTLLKRLVSEDSEARPSMNETVMVLQEVIDHLQKAC